MNRILPAAIAVAAAPSLFAPAAHAAPERIRGTVQQVGTGSLVVKEQDGGTVTVGTDGATKYAFVVPSSLDAIRPNDFVGTATKGPKGFMVALELVIFPEAMRGAGEGHYGWDPLPDTTRRRAAGSTTADTMTMSMSSMTNGKVAAASPVGAARTGTSMTNGTVSKSSADAAGRTLTVSYGPGQSAEIIVPPTATIARLEPATAAAATAGSTVFIKAAGAGDAPVAQFVAVGKGIAPPM